MPKSERVRRETDTQRARAREREKERECERKREGERERERASLEIISCTCTLFQRVLKRTRQDYTEFHLRVDSFRATMALRLLIGGKPTEKALRPIACAGSSRRLRRSVANRWRRRSTRIWNGI